MSDRFRQHPACPWHGLAIDIRELWKKVVVDGDKSGSCGIRKSQSIDRQRASNQLRPMRTEWAKRDIAAWGIAAHAVPKGGGGRVEPAPNAEQTFHFQPVYRGADCHGTVPRSESTFQF